MTSSNISTTEHLNNRVANAHPLMTYAMPPIPQAFTLLNLAFRCVRVEVVDAFAKGGMGSQARKWFGLALEARAKHAKLFVLRLESMGFLHCLHLELELRSRVSGKAVKPHWSEFPYAKKCKPPQAAALLCVLFGSLAALF